LVNFERQKNINIWMMTWIKGIFDSWLQRVTRCDDVCPRCAIVMIDDESGKDNSFGQMSNKRLYNSHSSTWIKGVFDSWLQQVMRCDDVCPRCTIVMIDDESGKDEKTTVSIKWVIRDCTIVTRATNCGQEMAHYHNWRKSDGRPSRPWCGHGFCTFSTLPNTPATLKCMSRV
jgi:hypothetical protein